MGRLIEGNTFTGGTPVVLAAPKVLQLCAVDVTAWFVLRGQIAAMAAHGWDVSVACTEGPYLDRLREKGVRTFPITIERSSNVLSHFGSIRKLSVMLKQEQFDVVIAHTPIASMVGRLAAKLAGVPLVIYTAHGFYFHENMSQFARFRHIQLERFFAQFTDHLFTVSSEDAETAVKQRIMPLESVTAIGNGVDTVAFKRPNEESLADWRAKLSIPEEDIVVGIVGRLVEEKGFIEFFQAAVKLLELHQNVSFLVVGGSVAGDRDTLNSKLRDYLEHPQLRRKVFFTGFTEDIPECMHLMDIFTLPSHREGLPLSILEAMAASKPVVATNIRGCREEVVDGETGFLVPLKDADALADRLGTLCADAELRARFGHAGRLRAEALFDERIVNERIIGYVQALLSDKGVVPSPQARKQAGNKYLSSHPVN